MRRQFMIAAGAALLLLALGFAGSSFAGGLGHLGCKCPQCGCLKVCDPIPEVVKDKRHTWEVERKDICIPGVKCPFASCCTPPKCGKVISVKKLKKIEYECEKCGYKWEVRTVCCEPCGCN